MYSFSSANLWKTRLTDYLWERLNTYGSRVSNDIEIEARLGIQMNDGRFVPDMGQRYFDKQYNIYMNQMRWDDREDHQKPQEDTEIALIYKDDCRMIFKEDSNGKYALMEAGRKIKIDNETAFFEDRRLCIRFSTAHEDPLNENEKDSYLQLSKSILYQFEPMKLEDDFQPTEIHTVPVKYRLRKRTSFYYHSLRIDMTRTKSHENFRQLQFIPWHYEIECELYKNSVKLYDMFVEFIRGFFARVVLVPENKLTPPQNLQSLYTATATTTTNSHVIRGYKAKEEGRLTHASGYSNDLKEFLKENDIVPLSILSQIPLYCTHSKIDKDGPLFQFLSLPCDITVEDRFIHISFGQYEFEMKHNQFDSFPLVPSAPASTSLKRTVEPEKESKRRVL